MANLHLSEPWSSLTEEEQKYLHDNTSTERIVFFFFPGIGFMRSRRWLAFFLLLMAAFIVGFINNATEGAAGVLVLALIIIERVILLKDFAARAYDHGSNRLAFLLTQFREQHGYKKKTKKTPIVEEVVEENGDDEEEVEDEVEDEENDGIEYNEDGYDEFGFDEEGYNRQGYDAYGYDKLGFNKRGFNKKGFDKNGFDKDGYNVKGYDEDGYDRNGFDYGGIHKDTGTEYDKNGYDKNGFDKDGWSTDGISEDTHTKYDRFGYDKNGNQKPKTQNTKTVKKSPTKKPPKAVNKK